MLATNIQLVSNRVIEWEWFSVPLNDSLSVFYTSLNDPADLKFDFS